ncbi:MAG: bifunctional glutamate N-acetyltransferase/amino-acid acetyltransferase ArgJ [Clostridiales Family XIII bacterium]|jgi:glutamate N-acetyltransferase/amino-acid N-acetyltransferase|nr:bifunctional glutamate N-acetyltransferase/amino-acid acetyltransferase ArgJ [Clostridiales Family XIII bacterium]
MASFTVRPAEGGICAPKGYRASGVHCGFRKNTTKKDLCVIASDVMANAAAVFTRNKVQCAPIAVCRAHLRNGRAQAIIVNSGNANACAPGGEALARDTCALVAGELGLSPQDVLVASTGVIGQPIDFALFEKGVPRACRKLAGTAVGSADAAKAIMTTDKVRKEQAVTCRIGGKQVTVGGIAKGSGMINPNMATMLCFLTTDAAISPKLLGKALRLDAEATFNQLNIDGDTSTNDTVAILANGLAGNAEITEEGEDFDRFCAALRRVTEPLVRMLAKDGEGATKLLEVTVTGAPTVEVARKVSASVVSSDLVKTAVFGEDANWGRVLCATGYADARFSAADIAVEIASKAGKVKVCEGSGAARFSEAKAAKILAEDEIAVRIDLHDGEAQATAWGCDLTYGYVRINGSYRT